MQEGYVPPFLRNLPYNQASTIIPENIIPIKKKQKPSIINKNLEYQQDVEESAKALGLDDNEE